MESQSRLCDRATQPLTWSIAHPRNESQGGLEMPVMAQRTTATTPELAIASIHLGALCLGNVIVSASLPSRASDTLHVQHVAVICGLSNAVQIWGSADQFNTTGRVRMVAIAAVFCGHDPISSVVDGLIPRANIESRV